MKNILLCLIKVILVCFPVFISAQQINLDKPVKAGELILFPEMTNPNSYYYLSDKPRLAKNADGRPKFSFLRYVDNNTTEAGQKNNDEGDGGGIVHAVISLAVSPEQISAARLELQRIKPGAVIKGPVIYNSGTFGIVSAFKDSSGRLTKRVLGLGNAPLLDGQQASISIELTRMGSKILWESFRTRTPDISFTFEMKVKGFREPQRAIIEADFSKIYKHAAFSGGFANTWLAAEVNAVYDDLRRTGAIKLTTIGNDDSLNRWISIAYNQLTQIMFAPATPVETAAGALDVVKDQQEQNLMDKASRMLDTNKKEARATNKELDERRKLNDPIAGEEKRKINEKLEATLKKIDEEEQEELDKITKTKTADKEQNPVPNPAGGSTEKPPVPFGPQKKPEENGVVKESSAGTSTETEKEKPAESNTPPKSKSEEPVKKDKNNDEEKKIKEKYDAKRKQARSEAEADIKKVDEKYKIKDVSVPGFAVMAKLQLKYSKQTGIYKIDLNKSIEESISARFDENIGDLTSFINNNTIFRQINLDDPLFIQREVTAFVDGINASDFGQFVNFVNVRLRKTHGGGDISNKEIRIDKSNFSKEGNNFKMIYGWKEDNDRSKWMDYEFETEWSFFGGQSVKIPFQQSKSNTISLTPPLQRQSIIFQGNPDSLGKSGVRLVTARVFFKQDEKESVRQVTLNPGQGIVSSNAEILLPQNVFDYEFEITWRLNNNTTKTSGRLKGSEFVVFVDKIPD